jgi:hypothetical protein
VPIDQLLTQLGYSVVGSATAGMPETARFAWIDATQLIGSRGINVQSHDI